MASKAEEMIEAIAEIVGPGDVVKNVDSLHLKWVEQLNRAERAVSERAHLCSAMKELKTLLGAETTSLSSTALAVVNRVLQQVGDRANG